MARVRTLIRQRPGRYQGNLDVLLDETCSALALRLAEDAANPAEDELDFFEVRFAPALHYFLLHRLAEDTRWYSLHQSVDGLTDDDGVVDGALPGHNDLTDPERAALAAEINDVLHLLTDEEHQIHYSGPSKAGLGLAWRYLCEFAGMDSDAGGFLRDLLTEMNGHVAETSADREPWVWIMETVLSEIDGGNYKHPYTFDTVDGEFSLLLRTGHVMDHIAHTSALRDKWNALPVKSDRVFKAQLKHAGVVVGEKEVERRIFTRRVPYLTPISLQRLAAFGLHVAVREDLVSDSVQGVHV